VSAGTRRAGVAVAALVAAGAASPSPPAFEREIVGLSPGRVAVALDASVYEGARRDLADLRIRDDQGAAVPYLLECGATGGAPEPLRPTVLNRSFVRGQAASVALDFGDRVRKRELLLRLSGDNFRRRVMVEGSDDGQRWDIVTDTAYVFAVPGPSPARYETVSFPENDQPRLRVTVFMGPDDPPRIEIDDVSVRGETARLVEIGRAVVPSVTTDERAHETLLTLDLGARHQPFRGITLDVAEPRFFRGAVVEVRADPQPPARPGQAAPPLQWIPLGEGALYRYPAEDGRGENLRLAVSGRDRVLRVRIRNRDDRPLTVRGVTVWSPVERLLFEAQVGRRYRVTYGSPDLHAPEYDLQRTADAEAWGAVAREARLGPAAALPPSSIALPWTERHPALLWTGLVVIVGLLGVVTWRALQAAS